MKNEEEEGILVPFFGTLIDIISITCSADIIFIVRMYTTISYTRRFAAYHVEETGHNVCFFAASLKCHYLFSCIKIAGKQYIKSKYDLSGK